MSAVALASQAKSDLDVYFQHPEVDGKSLDDLLARADISAVISCVTIPAQPGIVRKAIAAGKHVLSEKPVAQNVITAKELITWYNSQTAPPIWAVGENFRFNESVKYAELKIRDIGGRLTAFRLSYNGFVKKDNKYFNTDWRKTPEFQGGFVLDTGVHFVAVLRLLLAAVGDEITQLLSYSGLLQNHLNPIDTVHSIVCTKGGRHGTICISFGTEFKSGLEIEVTTTNGAVLWTPVGVKSTTKSGSGEISDEEKAFVYNNAIRTEIEAFSKAVVAGAPDPRQTPLEALKDLFILQALIESGESGASAKDILD